MELKQGKLIGIAIREKSRAPMVEVNHARISAEQGIEGDYRGKPGSRQVTIMSSEDWEAACHALGRQLPWTTRRANLLVEGIRFRASTDSILQIGSVALQVTGETEPCSRMDEAAAGLCSALAPDWRGGVCCRVLQGGVIEPNATVTIEPQKD